MEKNGKIKVTSIITVSAYCEDYSHKAYKFYFADTNYEFVPKSQIKFLERATSENNDFNLDYSEFGKGRESRYFEMPLWLFSKLKGHEFYMF